MSKIALEGNASGTGTFTVAAPNSNSNYTLTLPQSTGTVVVTGGAQTIEFAAGTASTPSITFTGDTNTGIFSPAADTIAFTEGGAESMRIDSSGRVGIGTTSPATLLNVSSATTNVARLRVTGTGSTSGNYRGYEFASSGGFSGGIFQDEGTSALSFWSSSGGSSMVVDSSGNVGIGTSSPDTKLNTEGGALRVSGTRTAGSFLDINPSNTGTDGVSISVSYYGSSNYGPVKFTTGGSERARITSGGDFCVGTTSKVYEGVISVSFNGGGGTGDQGIALIDSNATLNGDYAIFINSAGNVAGKITHNGTTTVAYTTSSDYRLKENISPMTGALAKVAQLKPVTYSWKDDQSESEGFIAHELAEVCPQAVVGEKDAVDAEGKPVYQGIDTSFLVATLTAAIQELKAINDAQATRIETLETKVAVLENK